MLERLIQYFSKASNGLSIVMPCDDTTVEDYAFDPYSNPSFSLAMQKRVEATKIVEIGIFKGEDKNKVEQTKHKLVNLTKYVNGGLSYKDFIAYVLNWSLGSNNGVLIEKVAGLPSMAPDLVVYAPSNFTIYNSSNKITKIQINNPSRVVMGEELKNFIWIRQPNFYQEVAGFSPTGQSTGNTTQNAMSVIGSYIKKVWRWNWALAKNSGRVNGIISSKDNYNLTKEDREEITDKYTAMSTGLNNGKPIVIGGNATYQDTSKAPTDIDWKEGEVTAHERICLSLGVPPELVGSGESTYTNRQEAKKELYTDTIIPWYKTFVGHLNRLLEKELAGAYFDIKIGSIEALKVDKAEELKALETAKDRMTVNEYRKEYSRITGVELKDLPNGDAVVIGVDTLDNIITDPRASDEKVDDI